jgi:hypothetical protein
MSMLQDLERGRSLEIDALVAAVQELGRLTGVATPMVDAVLALIQERGRGAGLYAPLGAPPSRCAARRFIAQLRTLRTRHDDSLHHPR